MNYLESPAKKMKIDDEISTNPFFKLHEDIHPLIIQHMTSQEVLKLFTVSSKTYHLISGMPAAMNQIQLQFQERNSYLPSAKQVTELLKSERKYRNVKAEFRYVSNAGRKLLLLERFCQSMVTLKISCFKDNLTKFFPPNLSFPKLKTLDTKGYATTSLKLLQASPQIVNLSLVLSNMHSECFRTAVMEMSNLNEMTIHGERDYFFRNYSLAGSKFKLKVLTIEERSTRQPLGIQARMNFNIFVQLQQLETLRLVVYFSEDLNLAINNLPTLKHLDVQRFIGSQTNLQLKPNQNIISLKCTSVELLPTTELLTCLESLELLTVRDMSKEDFQWIVRRMPHLKKLHITGCYDFRKGTLNEAEGFYSELKRKTTANQNLTIEMRDH
jgi:hypothetical protein